MVLILKKTLMSSLTRSSGVGKLDQFLRSNYATAKITVLSVNDGYW